MSRICRYDKLIYIIIIPSDVAFITGLNMWGIITVGGWMARISGLCFARAVRW